MKCMNNMIYYLYHPVHIYFKNPSSSWYNKNLMDIRQIIKKRRSIRRYKKRGIPDRLLEELLDLARCAPSSMNGQPWHFFVIRDQRTKKELVRIKNKYCPPEKRKYEADFLLWAPVVVVVCVERKRGYDRGVETAVLATGTLMLAAADKGLGSVYMSAYKTGEPGVSKEIRQIVGIPKKFDPVTLVPLGYAQKPPKTKRLRALSKLITYDTPAER